MGFGDSRGDLAGSSSLCEDRAQEERPLETEETLQRGKNSLGDQAGWFQLEDIPGSADYVLLLSSVL